MGSLGVNILKGVSGQNSGSVTNAMSFHLGEYKVEVNTSVKGSGKMRYLQWEGREEREGQAAIAKAFNAFFRESAWSYSGSQHICPVEVGTS